MAGGVGSKFKVQGSKFGPVRIALHSTLNLELGEMPGVNGAAGPVQSSNVGLSRATSDSSCPRKRASRLIGGKQH